MKVIILALCLLAFLFTFSTQTFAVDFTVNLTTDQHDTLSASFNPFNNEHIKPWPNDFAPLGELDQSSITPQAQLCSTLSFAATNFTAASSPYVITTGDFNGDGKLDLAATNQYSDTVSVLLNTCTVVQIVDTDNDGMQMLMTTAL